MSDKDSKFNILAIGLVGAVAGYLIGKKYGSQISTEVKRVTENPTELKKDLEKFKDNSSQMLEDVRGKVTDILGQVEDKIKAVDAIIGQKDGEKGDK
tara:strand:+ start:689 stop:979 length:291 start_codon:yes stop_codon:yes gene_type:complete